MLINVEIPDEFVQALPLPAREAQTAVREEVALGLYARGWLSLGKAAELAGGTRAGFEVLLARRRIERPFDVTELARDLAWGVPPANPAQPIKTD